MTEVFVITAIWDVVLRAFAERRVRFGGIEDWDWVVALRPYFAQHTVLGAALIAGFVGAVAFVVMMSFWPDVFDQGVWTRLAWVAIVSAAVGLPMRYSGLFPHLKAHYYDQLPVKTIFTDALSGVIVAVSVGALDALRFADGK